MIENSLMRLQMRKKSYSTERTHYKPKEMVPSSFIEGVLKGLCKNSEITWFQFTSNNRNVTKHDKPNITEETSHIYFYMPPLASFTAGQDFLDIIDEGGYKDTDPLPNCYYEAVKRKAFLEEYTVKAPHPTEKGKMINDTRFRKFTSLNQKLETYGDLPGDFLEKYNYSKIRAREDIRTKVQLTNDVAARVQTVCENLPKRRPITLTFPLHFPGGGHYHTYNARITDNIIEIQAVKTIKHGYPDKKVLAGIKKGIIEGLGLNEDEIEFKDESIYVPQGDIVSCGPISTIVSFLVDPNETLANQKDQMREAIQSYNKNSAKAKSALADIYYATKGIVLNDENSKKPSPENIRTETEKYCSVFNKVRPFTFGLRIRTDENISVYAIRVTDDGCETLAISDLSEEDNKNNITAIQQGVKNALDVSDEFFLDPINLIYHPDDEKINDKPTTKLVATQIEADHTLEVQQYEIANKVIGEAKYLKAMRENQCETTFSFKSFALSKENILEKHESFVGQLRTALNTQATANTMIERWKNSKIGNFFARIAQNIRTFLHKHKKDPLQMGLKERKKLESEELESEEWGLDVTSNKMITEALNKESSNRKEVTKAKNKGDSHQGRRKQRIKRIKRLKRKLLWPKKKWGLSEKKQKPKKTAHTAHKWRK